MIQTIGDLREKGLSLYADKELNVKIENGSVYPLIDNREFTAYISVDRVWDDNKELGKMFILEEYYKVFMLDMVQVVDGVSFRNYDNLEALEVEFSFDTRAFLESVFENLKGKRAIDVLLLLAEGGAFFAKTHIQKSIEKVLDEETRSRFLTKDDTDEEKYEPNPPIGFWPSSSWPPEAYYTFYRDWFRDPLERDRLSIWEQYWVNDEYIRRAFGKQVRRVGIPGEMFKANYKFDIYPTHKALLDNRTMLGGFEIEQEEYRTTKKEIFDRFDEWYDGTSQFGFSQMVFVADRQTVSAFTGIGLVETYRIYQRDKGILERLLGPIHCKSYNSATGACDLWEYGSVFDPNTNLDEQNLLEVLTGEAERISASDIAETYRYYDGGIRSKSHAEVQTEAVREGYSQRNPSAMECLYAAELFNGQLGGQTVFHKGLGTEHEYFDVFGDFLKKRNITVSDLLDLYEEETENAISVLADSISVRDNVNVRDFCEFYSRETRSPFDGIHIYVPFIPMMSGEVIEVRKKKVLYDASGAFTEEEAPIVLLTTSDYKIPFDKDEYVDSIRVNGANVLMSKYTRIKVHAKFKQELSNIDDIYLRLSNSDLTYLNLREMEL